MLNYFRHASLANKIRLPLAFIALVVFFQSFSSYRALSELSEKVNHQNQKITVSLRLLLDADKDLYQAKTSELALIALSVDPDLEANRNKFSAKRERDLGQAESRVLRALANLSMSRFDSKLNTFKRNFKIWKSMTDEALSKAESGDTHKAISISILESDQYFNLARESLDDIADALISQTEENVESISHLSEETNQLILTLAAITAVLLMLMLSFVPKSIAAPAIRLRNSLAELAHGDGDLSRRLEVESKDELGQVSDAYNTLMSKLHNSISKVSDASHNLKNNTAVLHQISEETHQLSKIQRDEITAVVTAVEEMSSAVKEVAQSANQVAQATQGIEHQAGNGEEVVERASVCTETLAKTMDNSVQVIGNLEKEAASIASVLAVISSIAEQTNLLALNAAIEAARAGEQGRGFAVVADEVRVLASRTQSATEDITTMIETLQRGVNEAVTSIEKGNTQVTETVESVESARVSFTTIRAEITNASNMCIHIATATEEQSAVINDISQNLTAVDNKVQQTTENAEQLLKESELVSNEANSLSHVVEEFKL